MTGDGVVLVGFGAIGRAVWRILTERGTAGRIVAIGLRDGGRRDGLPEGVPVLVGPKALAGVNAGLVVEVAGRDAVVPWGRAALAAGVDFAVSSASAFADDALLAELTALAVENRSRLILPPGALGGMDALAAAARMGLDKVHHTITKPPIGWKGTEAESLCNLMGLTYPQAFFTGSAREAATRFPQNANVAMISALAGLGPDQTQVTLVADPDARGNRHDIVASGTFGRMQMQFENAPLADNPKSSAMTALSMVRLIENNGAGLVI